MTTQTDELAELMADLAILQDRNVAVNVGPSGQFALSRYSMNGPGGSESGPFGLDDLLVTLRIERKVAAEQFARKTAAVSRGLTT